MTLYDHPDCPFAKKVRIVLLEKDLEFDVVTVDLEHGEQRSEEFLKLNPFGKVPVLVDEGCVIYDSTIINEYLNDEYPLPELLPQESADRARVRLLEDFADNAFTLPAMAAERELAKPAGERDDNRLSTAKDVLSATLRMLDRELAGREFLGGEFSLADVAFAPTALRLDRLGITLGSDLRNVKAWVARLTARASVGSVAKLVA